MSDVVVYCSCDVDDMLLVAFVWVVCVYFFIMYIGCHVCLRCWFGCLCFVVGFVLFVVWFCAVYVLLV